jgi:membrane protease YdiL (CAAX protease family)
MSERLGTGRLTAWASIVGLLATLGYIGRFSGGELPKEPLYRWDEFVGGLVQFLLLLGLMLAVAWGVPKRETFALRRPHSWRRAFGIMLVVAVVVVGVSAVLEPILHPDKEQGLAPTRWEPAHAGAFVANFVVVALLAPVVEELTFRGLGFTLLERFGRPAAIVLVGLAFGLAHGLVEGLPLLFLFGAGLAYLRSRTGSVYPGMVIHVVYNGLVLLIAVKFFHTGALPIPF